MQRFLTKLTPDEAAAQHQRIAAEVDARVQEERAAAALRPPPRGPGRPPSARCSAAASTADFSTADEEDECIAAPTDAPRVYTSWLTSEWFPFIHDAVQRVRSLRGAVRSLQQRFPRVEGQQQGVFDSLGHGTLQRWYEIDSNGIPSLRDEFQRFLPCDRAAQPVRGGYGPLSFWDRNPDVTTEVRATLSRMRDAGVALGIPLVKWVIAGVSAKHSVGRPPLSTFSVSEFARNIMFWSWRTRNTSAQKLPDDWREQGRLMARRIAALMQLSSVPSTNVVNIDQTGLVLIPVNTHTYEQRGGVRVAIAGAEKKRQITAVLGSSLAGAMLPLQLIFEGKTERSRPPHTPGTLTAGFHLTNSDNHWSTLETMKEYVNFVLDPWRRKAGNDAEMVLLLDAWSVHRSKEFRDWMDAQHKRIHLVFVPANCTGMLQIADVALNRPFKASIRNSFNDWAAAIVAARIAAGEMPSLKSHFGIKELRPLMLQWSLTAWQHLSSAKLITLNGWQRCVKQYCDVDSEEDRKNALTASIRGDFKVFEVPDNDEAAPQAADVWEGEDDHERDDSELDLAKPRVFGQRRSKRKRSQGQRQIGAYMLDSSQIELSDDD